MHGVADKWWLCYAIGGFWLPTPRVYRLESVRVLLGVTPPGAHGPVSLWMNFNFGAESTYGSPIEYILAGLKRNFSNLVRHSGI